MIRRTRTEASAEASAADRIRRRPRRPWTETHRHGFEVQWLSSYFYPDLTRLKAAG